MDETTKYIMETFYIDLINDEWINSFSYLFILVWALYKIVYTDK